MNEAHLEEFTSFEEQHKVVRKNTSIEDNSWY
jgi:hypothetical protein